MKHLLSRRFLTVCLSCLSLTFIAGMCDPKKDPIPVPVALFEYYPETNLVAPITMGFFNKSTHATSYVWTYGNGQTETDKDLYLVIKSGGTYTVTLKATGEGGTNTYSRTVFIANPTTTTQPPSNTTTTQTSAGFTYSPGQNLVAPAKVTFTNTSKNADSYKWDFGDGNTSTETSPTKEFTKAGTLKVKLTATGKNNSAEYTADITINAATAMASPTADFTFAPNTPTIEDLVTFSNKSNNATSYEWDFGNGTTSVDKDPVKKFTKAGPYNVKLKTKGSDGKTAEVTKTITVTEYTATVSFFTRTDLGYGHLTVGEANGAEAANKITKTYPSGITCGQSDVWMKVNPRTFNWLAEAANGIKWAGTVQLESGKCYAIELTKNNIINGIVTFWTKTDLKVGKINVSVNGVAQGSITQSHTNGVTCGNGNVNAKFTVGTYKFKAVADDGSTWEDNVAFERGICNTRELTKSATPTPTPGANCDFNEWGKYLKQTKYEFDPKGGCTPGWTRVWIQNTSNTDLAIRLCIQGPDGKWTCGAGKIAPGEEIKQYVCGKALSYKVWGIPSSKSSVWGDSSCKFPTFP